MGIPEDQVRRARHSRLRLDSMKGQLLEPDHGLLSAAFGLGQRTYLVSHDRFRVMKRPCSRRSIRVAKDLPPRGASEDFDRRFPDPIPGNRVLGVEHQPTPVPVSPEEVEHVPADRGQVTIDHLQPFPTADIRFSSLGLDVESKRLRPRLEVLGDLVELPNLGQNLECDVRIVRDRELLTEAEPPEEKNDQNEDKGEWKPIK